MFGEGIQAATSTAGAAWLMPARGWGVGWLVPAGFEAIVRVAAPPPVPDVDGEVWWAAYRRLFEELVAVAGRHTATPDRACFAVWEGHGFDRVVSPEELRGAGYLRFHRPHRSHLLLEGPLGAVGALRHPGGAGWRNPDLVWPEDRRWLVATDVDLWSVYLAGTEALVAEVAAAASTATERVTLDDPLPVED